MFKKLWFALTVVLLAGVAVFATVQAQEPTPEITHGPISGEVSAEAVTLWARGNVTGTLTFAVSSSEDLAEATTATAEVVAADDFTGEALVDGLEPGQTYFYEVTFEVDGSSSDPVAGQFVTAPATDDPAAFDFVFGACLGGQGYCRPPDTGWTIFNEMAAEEPDFFLITGDSMYASGACPVPANEPGAEAPATDLTSFRDRYKYHLADENYANFLSQTPVFVGWDDHEVRDNYSGPEMAFQNAERLVSGRQAFFEFWPVAATDSPTDTYQLYRNFTYGAQAEFFVLDTRSYRDPIVNWDPNPVTLEPKTMLGEAQLEWLRTSLSESESTWKFIVTSVPLAYPTGFPQPQVEGRDSWANFTDKSGYETELLSLLFYIESQGIDNVIFLTGDTHWPFAISYDPDRDGEPNFYEFASSPLSAIVLPPAPDLDPTLNPTVLYAEGEFQGTLFNFGQISVDEAGVLTFRIIDREGVERYSQTVEPELSTEN